MSLSVHIKGVRHPDGKLRKMAEFKLRCDDLEIAYPDDLREYFKGTDALDSVDMGLIIRSAIEVDLRYDLQINGLIHGEVEYEDGAIIDLEKLPDDIKQLRIYMS